MIEIIGRLVVPSGLVTLLAVGALLGLLVLRSRRIAVIAGVAAIGVYIVFGSGLVAHALLGPLERLHTPVVHQGQLGEIDTIVVLTAYASRLDSVSPPSWVSESSAYRILEAMWLKRHFTAAKILISGTPESSRSMRDLLLSLGLPAEEVLVDAPAEDTAMSATRLRRSVGNGKRCALVTSAGHMPRAVLSLNKQGITCAPVATEFYTPYPLGPLEYMPSPHMLKLSDHAIHEYIGILWHRMLGNL